MAFPRHDRRVWKGHGSGPDVPMELRVVRMDLFEIVTCTIQYDRIYRQELYRLNFNGAEKDFGLRMLKFKTC